MIETQIWISHLHMEPVASQIATLFRIASLCIDCSLVISFQTPAQTQDFIPQK